MSNDDIRAKLLLQMDNFQPVITVVGDNIILKAHRLANVVVLNNITIS